MSVEFEKQVSGERLLAQFPSMCLCGSQSPPVVDTFMDKPGYGRVYLCRLCTTRAARALGLVKGDEHTRLGNIQDLLAHAEGEIGERDRLIEKMTKTGAERDLTIGSLRSYIETLQAEISQMRHLASLVATNAREMVEV
jgi:hypothetical protein